MTEMTEADRKAFEKWRLDAKYCWSTPYSAAERAWQSALTHARGKQEPVAWSYEVSSKQYLVLHKPTVTSSVFNFTPLYKGAPTESEEVARLRAIEAAALAWWEGRTPRDSREIALCAALASSPAPETVINAVCASPAIIKPKVKALVWPEKTTGPGSSYEGTGGLIRYFMLHGRGFQFATPGEKWSKSFESYEEAKAAAQADYERRILSAIDEGGEDE